MVYCYIMPRYFGERDPRKRNRMRTLLFIPAADAALAGKGLSFLSTVIDIIITFLLASLLIAAAKRIISGIVRSRAGVLEEHKARRLMTAGTLLMSVIRYAVFFIAIAIAVGELGYSGAMNSMLAAAGIGSLAIGIGAQNIIKDVAAGISMLFEDQLSVGDYVSLAGVTGTVEAVSLRTVTIRQYGGEVSIVPNGSIGVLTNYSRTDSLAIAEIPVSQEADTALALSLMKEEAARYYGELGDIATAEPEVVGAVQLAGGEMVLRVVQRVKPLEHWGVERELRKRIVSRFVKEGIALPKARVELLQ